MSPGSRREREQKALDALLVSQLRRHGCEGGEFDPDELPELTDEEKIALKALGPNYMERLIAGEVSPPSVPRGPSKRESREPALAGGDLAFGLNRAEEVDPEAAEELARRRREIIERVRRRREQEESEGA